MGKMEEIGRVEGWGGLEIKDIPECGADAMRFAVCLHTQLGGMHVICM